MNAWVAQYIGELNELAPWPNQFSPARTTFVELTPIHSKFRRKASVIKSEAANATFLKPQDERPFGIHRSDREGQRIHKQKCIKFEDFRFEVTKQACFVDPKRMASAVRSENDEDMFLKQIGCHIRNLRRARNLGIEPFADQVGLHRTHLYKIEKGQLNAGILTFRKIANVLGLSLGELFSNQVPKADVQKAEQNDI